MDRPAAHAPAPSRLFRLSYFCSVVSVFSVVNTPASAQEVEVIIENIRVGLRDSFDKPVYKVGTWTPVQVDLQAGPERFQGVMRVLVGDDDGTPQAVVEPVDVPARTMATFTTYVRPGSTTAEFTVQVFREGRRRPVTTRPTLEAEGLDPGQVLIATLGRTEGVNLIPDLAEFKPEAAGQAGLQGTSVRVVPLRVPDGIPSRWYGYDGVDVVVLDANDGAALPALDAFRNLALKEWVRNGGHLVVAVGERWQVANDSFLAEMIPARPNGQTSTRDLGMVESFAGSNKPITTPDGPEASVTTLVLNPARSAKALDLSGRNPVLVRGSYGLGRVTVIGLDVDRSPFRDWPDRAQFWVRVLDLPEPLANAAGTNPAAFYGGELRDLSSYLHKSLEQFEGVRLIPFAWVAFFVFLYILLIGPGDYFFLKKVVKRMELTWVTFPAIVLAVSLLAYASAYAIKGTDLRINRVDVVDVDQGFGGPNSTFLARGTSFSTLFSPQNRDYELGVVPLALTGPSPALTEAVAGAAPEGGAGVETITTWYGMAESGFRGMAGGNAGRVGLGGEYSYGPLGGQPIGEPEAMRGVRVPIWTTKSLESTWFDAVPAVLDADLKRIGDGLDGSITNRLDRPLKGLAVAFGRHVYLAQREVAPGETVRIDALKPENLGNYLGRIGGAIPTLNAYSYENEQVNTSRADLVRALMFNGIGRPKGLKPSVALRDLDLSGQIELDRPAVVAEVDGPASALVLGGRPPKEPKVSQTTVMRVLLPAVAE